MGVNLGFSVNEAVVGGITVDVPSVRLSFGGVVERNVRT